MPLMVQVWYQDRIRFGVFWSLWINFVLQYAYILGETAEPSFYLTSNFPLNSNESKSGLKVDAVVIMQSSE